MKIPALLQDQNPDPNIADFILDAQSGQTNFIANKQTQTFGYNGSYLGPVLRIRKGEKVNIQVNNQLNFPTTIHWHGLVVDGEQDGGPHQGIQPGESWSPTFTVDQSAATLWFHPHLMGDTADQVYYGLAGLIYIDDQISQVKDFSVESDQLDLAKDGTIPVFTAKEDFTISCWMNMLGMNIKVVDDLKTADLSAIQDEIANAPQTAGGGCCG